MSSELSSGPGSDSEYLSSPSSHLVLNSKSSNMGESGASIYNNDVDKRRDHLILVKSCDVAGQELPQNPVRGQATTKHNNVVVGEEETTRAKLASTLELNNHMKQEEGILRDMVRYLLAKVDNMSSQIRELQLLILQGNLVSQNSTESFANNKKEQMFKPQDQVFQTPKKTLERLSRLDVTPASLPSDTDQPNGVTSTVNANSRRSLTFPKSLEAMLERNKENCFSTTNNNARAVSRDLLERDGPTPKLSLVDIKVEPAKNNSPHRLDSKLGLLVLADAALTRASEESTYFHKTGGSFLDCDSGLSSGNSCRSSPSLSQEVANKKTEPLPHYGIHSSNDLNLRSSSCLSTDAKVRKRRKMKQPLPCDFCGKCFNNQSSLRQHESFHRPVRPFKCDNDKCDKAYKTRSELNRHLVVHSGEKKHECKLCGKRFLRKQYLKTHLLRHHETGLAMVAPSAIDSFKNNSNETIPSIVVSSSLVSKTEPLTWRCQLCFKIFVNEEDLTRHVRSYHEKKKNVEGTADIASHSPEFNKM